MTVEWEAVETIRLGGKVSQLLTVEQVTGELWVQGRLFWSIETEEGDFVTIPRHAIKRTMKHELEPDN